MFVFRVVGEGTTTIAENLSGVGPSVKRAGAVRLRVRVRVRVRLGLGPSPRQETCTRHTASGSLDESLSERH